MTPIGPLSQHDDEQDRVADRQEDVRQAREDEGDRSLLDAEQRRQLLVVHCAHSATARGADEIRRAGVPNSDSAIGLASAVTTTSPSVAIPS